MQAARRGCLGPFAGDIYHLEVHIGALPSEMDRTGVDIEQRVLRLRPLGDVEQRVDPRLHQVEALAEDVLHV